MYYIFHYVGNRGKRNNLIILQQIVFFMEIYHVSEYFFLAVNYYFSQQHFIYFLQ